MFIRISNRQVFFRNLLAKVGLAKPLYKYDFSASCPNGIVLDVSEYGMIGQNQAYRQILDILIKSGIDCVYYSVDKITANTKTVDRYLKIYPDSNWAQEIKNYTGWRKWLYSIGGVFIGFDYFLYFENECDRNVFILMR